ncbi:MAG: hypothetical protein COU11_01370 [Candidatus Harrisonbacteria bacterium CG10_big_fil_rev_8_21_14_0_10_49_15]|uniref:Uncharacterized protein n=1 Tax=Candidatus Harrisonbacteria bacterium CG10_big_fil_rev_8_21_14_0_10_49_15 TaxID=1974587 RepID=A0A2H0ULJ6_9BACT|nr:MAG: hypothetical protein COU11_01370 [Candidatus Harrisonbacteria bacterium CG10_big_fil_rev_8_21_14_0_10_49_15]
MGHEAADCQGHPGSQNAFVDLTLRSSVWTHPLKAVKSATGNQKEELGCFPVEVIPARSRPKQVKILDIEIAVQAVEAPDGPAVVCVTGVQMPTEELPVHFVRHDGPPFGWSVFR